MYDGSTGTPDDVGTSRGRLGELEAENARLRRELEAARRQAALSDAVLESATDYAVLTLDPGGQVTSWNAGAENLLGWGEAEALGMDCRLTFTPEDRERGAPERERAAAAAEGRAEDERWHVRKDGGRFRTSGLLLPLRGAAAPGFLKVMRDVTGRVLAEERLRASEELFRRFGEASSDVLWVRDADTLRFEYVSPAFEAVYGVGRGPVPGDGDGDGGDLARWASLIVPGDRGAALGNIARVRAGERVTHEFRVVRPSDGRVRWIRDTDFPLLDEAGRVRRVGGAGQDVTEEKEAAERQRRLARELDHRVKNVLAVVQALASQTLLAGGPPGELAEAFEGRLEALARAHGLLTSTGWAGADLGELVGQTLAPYLDGGAGPAADGPAVALPPRQAVALAMVLHELATNAAKYGALSVPGGRVGVGWEVDDGEGEGGVRRVRLAWREVGGPAVREPARKGFGTVLIEQSLLHDLEGTGGLRFEPDGLRCELSFPLG